MCRNIRPLHNFAPPASDAEVHEAALQYVRKLSGSARAVAGERATRSTGPSGRSTAAEGPRCAGARRAERPRATPARRGPPSSEAAKRRALGRAAALRASAGSIRSTLSSSPFDVLTNSAPSGPVRTARSRPNVSSSGAGTATEATAPSAPIVISSSFWPRSAADGQRAVQVAPLPAGQERRAGHRLDRAARAPRGGDGVGVAVEVRHRHRLVVAADGAALRRVPAVVAAGAQRGSSRRRWSGRARRCRPAVGAGPHGDALHVAVPVGGDQALRGLAASANGLPGAGPPVARSTRSTLPPSEPRSCGSVPRAVSPVPTSSAPSAPMVGRQPECRPDGFIGSPPTSGSARGRRASPSADSVHVTRRTSTGRPPSMWVWQVVNGGSARSRGARPGPSARPRRGRARRRGRRRPASPRRPRPSRTAPPAGPSRSVTSTRPSGRNPRSQTWLRPSATVLTRSSGVPVRLGWAVVAAGAEPAPPPATDAASGALHPVTRSAASAAVRGPVRRVTT